MLEHDGLVDDLRSEVALRPDPLGGRVLDRVGNSVIAEGQTEIPDAAGVVRLHQDVPALQVAMDDGRFGFVSDDLGVEVIEAAAGRVGDLEHGRWVQRLLDEEVVEGPELAELRDEPELDLHADVSVVRSDEAKDVRVATEAGLVDVDLVGPGGLLSRVEDLHGHFVAFVRPFPNLPVPTLADQLVEADLSGDRPLYQEGHPGPAATVVQEVVHARVSAGAGVPAGDGGDSGGGGARSQRPAAVPDEDQDDDDKRSEETHGEDGNGDDEVVGGRGGLVVGGGG